MENTLGIRIQNARKKAGLSQEALGEKLGVSRQAVSKWESDAAIPEVDNIIAMSKILDIPIGILLGVDDIKTSADEISDKTPGETSNNSYEELKTILDKWSENYSETSKTAKNRGKQLLATIALFIIIIAILINTVGSLKRKLNETNDRISRVEQRIMEQIGFMEYSIQNILEEGASLISDYEIEITSYDLKAKKYTVSIKVVPKEMDVSVEGKLVYSLGDGDNAVYAEMKNGAYFVENWTLPMNKIANLNLLLEGEGNTKTALIERDFGVSEDDFGYDIWVTWNYNIKEYGDRIIRFNVMDGFINTNLPARIKNPTKIEKIEAQIYLNQDVEPDFSEDISEVMNPDLKYDDYNIAEFSGYELPSPEYYISKDDLYAVLKITENNGNVFYRIMEAIEDGGSKMEFDDPGNTEWKPGEKYKSN